MVGYSHNFCATIAGVYQHCGQKGLQLEQCLPFSSGSLQSTSLYHEHQSVEMMALGRHQLNVSMFSELYGHFIQQQVLIISLQRATNTLGHTLCYLRASMGHLWPTTCLDVTHSWDWRFHLVVKDVQLSLVSLCFRLDFFYICTHFKKLLLYQLSI